MIPSNADNFSYFLSPYHCWFRDLGYPQLDLNFYDDGEWEIIEMLNSPVIPSQTKWHRVLANIRNVIPTYGFCKRYVELLDITKQAVWDREDAKTAEVENEWQRNENHAIDLATRAKEAITRNDDLMQRIVKTGSLKPASVDELRKLIPNHRL